MDASDSEAQGASILFPLTPSHNHHKQQRRGHHQHHRRANSASSDTGAAHRLSSTSSAYGGLDASTAASSPDKGVGYGVGENAETRSIKMGGSRPPSALRQSHRAGGGGILANNTNRASFAESDTGTVAGLGYLFLNNNQEDNAMLGSARKGILDGEGDGATPDGSILNGRTANRLRRNHGSAARANGSMGHATTGSEPPVPPLPGAIADAVYGGTALHYKGQSQHFDSEEAWYFLRALVGEELRFEEGQLWRLETLDSLDDSEDMEDEEDDRLDPADVPILRYLIKHFLLTLPLLRDTETGSGFWTDGLQVIIRKVHDADLSHQVDQGSRSLSSTIYGSYIHHALERFVSAGLKLASSGLGGQEENPLVALDFAPRDPPPISPAFSDGQWPSPSTRFALGKLVQTGDDSPQLSQKSTHGNGASTIAGPSNQSRAPLTPVSPASLTDQFGFPPSMSANGLTRSASRQTSGTEVTSPLAETASFVSARDIDGNYTPDPSHHSDEEGYPTRRMGGGLVPPLPPSTRGSGDSSPEEDARTISAATHTSQIGEATTTGENWFTWLPNEEGQPLQPARAEEAQPYVVDGDFGLFHQPTSNNTGMAHGRYVPTLSPVMASPLIDDSLKTQPPRSSSRAGQESTPEERRPSKTGFGLGSLFKKKKKATNNPNGSPQSDDSGSTVPSPALSSAPVMVSDSQGASRQLPAAVAQAHSNQQDNNNNTWVAAMALPPEIVDAAPPSSAPLAVDLVPKGGMPWPDGAPVPFWRGAPFQRLKWGGFETDVVGVRTTMFSKSFLIRVRRPGRLDEYVVRTEAQFQKFHRVLEKQFPTAHVRRLPASADAKKDDSDQFVRPTLTRSMSAATTIASPDVETPNPEISPSVSKSPSVTRLAAGLKDAANDPHASSEPRTPASPFARSLRAQSINGDTPVARRRRGSGAARPLSMSSLRSTVTLPAHLVTPLDFKKAPPHDAQRRAFRNWLRDTLSIRTVGHHKETAAFLLLGSIVPRDADVKDLRQREAVDEARRAARVSVAQGSSDRARILREAWAKVEEECIHGNGFSSISEALRIVSKIEKLPSRYVKSIEWMRTSFAETLYETLVASNTSGIIFGKLKALHAAFPYFLVRQAFRLSKSKHMAKVLQDILLARPFGSKSLLQKILATTLDDDPEKMRQEISRYRSRIGSTAMTEKLDLWVYHPDPSYKETVRKYARENNLELVLCILRGGDEPRLPSGDLDRVIKAGKSYRSFMKKNPSQLSKAQSDDGGIRLVLDLQMYLRLISRDRDANQIRQMLGDDGTAAALEVLCGPLVELLKRVYRVGNAANALSDFQKAMDQLIIIVEALRSRVQEPQKGVRIIARLLARHQQPLYDFIHSVHKGETIIEEFLQWGWTASVFLRRGLAQTVDLDSLIPTDREDQSFLLDEIQDLVEYHRQKRLRQYQNVCRRYAGDVDADDPVVVEGDGRGKSQVEPHVELKPRSPALLEIPYALPSFRQQLKRVFAV
ncbi:hypothetical protein T439DRAFT_69984 [Meredithblackwellia eburnea MCA 4105]